MVKEQQSLSLYQTCAFALCSNADAGFFGRMGGIEWAKFSKKQLNKETNTLKK